jgi:hypothetical protein
MTSNSYIVLTPKDDNYLYRLKKYSNDEICVSSLLQNYQCQYRYYYQNASYVQNIVLSALNYDYNQMTFTLGFFMREYAGKNGQDFYVNIFYSPGKTETILITGSFVPYQIESNKINLYLFGILNG